MTTFNTTNKQSFPAGEDLSVGSKKFRAVKLNSSGEVVLVTATTDISIGILQNEPQLGAEASVLTLGSTTKVVLGATLSIGSRVAPLANGKMKASAVGQFPVGILLEGGVDTDVVNMMIVSSTANA